mmetsp:Transcript_24874/g.63476  ORF Transcript_24874/g.63476 Transcript_24874/m.63476 type:complete len:1162 (+) Transcript_24874:52-3537(+)
MACTQLLVACACDTTSDNRPRIPKKARPHPPWTTAEKLTLPVQDPPKRKKPPPPPKPERPLDPEPVFVAHSHLSFDEDHHSSTHTPSIPREPASPAPEPPGSDLGSQDLELDLGAMQRATTHDHARGKLRQVEGAMEGMVLAGFERVKCSFCVHVSHLAEVLTNTTGFQAFVVITIYLNALTVSLVGWSGENELATWVEMFFSSLFLFEMLVRFAARGPRYLMNYGNFMEFFFVFFASLDALVLRGSNSVVSIFASLTIFRVFRVRRLVKAFPFLGNLHMLRIILAGAQSFLPTVFWAGFVIAILLYVAAIVTRSYSKAAIDKGLEALFVAANTTFTNQDFYGSISESMFTLFQQTTGDAWASGILRFQVDAETDTTSLIYLWGFSCLFTVCFTIGFRNIVMSIFVAKTHAVKKELALMDSKNKKGREEMAARKQMTAKLAEADVDGDGSISRDEYFMLLQDPEVAGWLLELGLSDSDSHYLWEMIAVEQDQKLLIAEFIEALDRLRAGARAVDILALHSVDRATTTTLTKFHETLSRCARLGDSGVLEMQALALKTTALVSEQWEEVARRSKDAVQHGPQFASLIEEAEDLRGNLVRPSEAVHAALTMSESMVMEENNIWQRIVSHSLFVAAANFVVLINAVTLAVFLDVEMPQAELTLGIGFNVLFSLELVFRLKAWGMSFFKHAFNVFEFWVVVGSLLALLDELVLNGALGLPGSVLTAFRLGRLFRASRLLHGTRNAQELRILIASVQGAFNILLWCTIFTVLVFYMAAVLATRILSPHHTEAPSSGLYDDFSGGGLGVYTRAKYFLTVPRTMGTLLQFATRDRWGTVTNNVIEEMGWSWVRFPIQVFVFGITCGILNLVASIFVKQTIDAEQMDELQRLAIVAQSAEKHASLLSRFFSRGSQDGVKITKTEYYKVLSSQKVKALLEVLDFSEHEAGLIWEVVDSQEVGSVIIADLVDEIMRARGSARTADLASLGKNDARIHSLQDAIGDLLNIWESSTITRLGTLGGIVDRLQIASAEAAAVFIEKKTHDEEQKAEIRRRQERHARRTERAKRKMDCAEVPKRCLDLKANNQSEVAVRCSKETDRRTMTKPEHVVIVKDLVTTHVDGQTKTETLDELVTARVARASLPLVSVAETPPQPLFQHFHIPMVERSHMR